MITWDPKDVRVTVDGVVLFDGMSDHTENIEIITELSELPPTANTLVFESLSSVEVFKQKLEAFIEREKGKAQSTTKPPPPPPMPLGKLV